MFLRILRGYENEEQILDVSEIGNFKKGFDKLKRNMNQLFFDNEVSDQ